MRPVNLIISAFGPYAEEISVDMDRLGKKGIYLITGDTGSGKTTIFDAITYALYGQASGNAREAGMLRSKYASPDTETFVELAFEYAEKIYTVRRNPEYLRPSKRGEGFTRQKADAWLRYPNGKVLTKTRDVTVAIEGILGIDGYQFTRIAMIAQGEFLRLLFAKTEERKEIFRRIFKTRPYEALQNRLKAAYSQLEKQRQETEQSIRQYMKDILYREDCKEEQEKPTEEEIPAFLEVMIEQDRLNYEKRQQDAERIRQEMEEVGRIIGKAEAGEKAEKELQKARVELEKERKNRVRRQEELKKAGKKLTEKEKLGELAAKNKAHLSDYDELEQLKNQLENREKKRKEEQQEAKKAKTYVTETNLEIEIHKKELEALKDIELQRERLIQNIQKQEERQQNLKSLEQQLREWEQTKEVLAHAVGEYKKASQKANNLQAVYNEQNRAFLNGQAGLLAEDLKDGEPCPVCGSSIHPSPAVAAGGAPAGHQVDAAKAAWEKAGDAQRKASAKAGELKGREENQKKELLNAAEKLFNEKELEAGQIKEVLAKAAKGESERFEQLLKEHAEICEKTERKKELEQKVPHMEAKLEQTKKLVSEIEKELALLDESIDNNRKEQEKYAKLLRFGSKKEAQKDIERLEAEKSEIERNYKQAEKALSLCREKESALAGSICALQQQAEEGGKADLQQELEKQKALKNQSDSISKELRKISSRLDHNENALKKLEKQVVQLEKIGKEWAQVKALSDTANGNLAGKEKIMMETYVQMTYFDRILARANTRFMIMSGGQYELKRSIQAENFRSQSGLDLDVIDHYNGTERSVKTLSGGEAFKASLSLALGLSDEIQSSAGGIRLDTMFVDEGFGSLDEESLQQAIAALAKLTEGNRLVGIISHVAELKEKIDCKIVIKKQKSGGSQIEF